MLSLPVRPAQGRGRRTAFSGDWKTGTLFLPATSDSHAFRIHPGEPQGDGLARLRGLEKESHEFLGKQKDRPGESDGERVDIGLLQPSRSAHVDAMVAEPNVDALAIQIHPAVLLFPKELMGFFLQAAQAGKPIALWLAGMESGRHENLMWLEEKGVPVFPSPEKAVRALAALHRLSRS